MDKEYARVAMVTVDGEEMIGFEISQDVLRRMNFVNGEILEVKTGQNELVFEKTGTIHDGTGAN